MRRIAVLPLLGLTYVLATGSAVAQPLSNPLTAEQVACNEAQLAGLLDRLSVDAIHRQQSPAVETQTWAVLSRTLLVTYSNRFGFFEGLAVAGWIAPGENAAEGTIRGESFLAFDLNPSIRTTLANPARPPLPQISLLREEASSALVGSSSPEALAVFLNPTAAPNATSGRLEINNLQTAGGQARSADVRPGRGLAGLTTSCHTELTDFDRFVFEILERIFRVQAPGNAARGSKVAIFRGEDPLTYRIDAYPVGAKGKVALDLSLQVDGAGHLQTGSLRILPGCAAGAQLGCTSAGIPLDFFLFPPVSGGAAGQTRVTSDLMTEISFKPGTTPSPVTADFVRLLSKTLWNG